MKRSIKASVLLIFLILFTALMLTGCDVSNSGKAPVSTPPPASDKAPDDADDISDVLVPMASGIKVEKNDKAIIDYSNTRDGYVMARYPEKTDMLVKLLITVPDETQYKYTLHPGNDYEVFPLSCGDGVYTIGVYRQVEGTKFSLELSATVEVMLTDEFAPFLRPNQYVNFKRSSAVVLKAAELTSGIDDVMDKVAAVYNYIVTNIVYDRDLADTVQSGYVPDLDNVLENGKGICFDYASVMTAMLRSLNIPTKLVIGYTGVEYHAWISVYSDETGWIDDIIFFNGDSWRILDPTFAVGMQSREMEEFIGDGSNYTEKYLH